MVCRPLVEAIGQRMAYEAAFDSKVVPDEVIRLFESNCVMHYDASWFIQSGGLKRAEIMRNDADAVNGLLPRLNELMSASGAQEHVTAPIVTSEDWAAFEASLTEYGSRAQTIKQVDAGLCRL